MQNAIPIEITLPPKPGKRNIIWFNPPYSVNVVTKVGKQFLSF